MRKLLPSDFEGKTITKAKILGVNAINLTFDDGKTLKIEVEYIFSGLYGMVANEPEPAEKPKKGKAA